MDVTSRLLLAVLAALGWVQHPPVLPGITVHCSMTPLPMNICAHTCGHMSLHEGRRSYYEKIKINFKGRTFGGGWS